MISVTTFSQTGYETYAKNMLESAKIHWPTELIAYTETPIQIEGVEVRDLFSIPHIQTFLTYIKNLPKAFGKVNGGYDYNFDLWKFCRKIFAQYDVLQNYKGKVFWLDADLFFLKPISEDYLNSLFDGYPLIFLGREGLYTETGFIGFDTEHKDFQLFLEQYMDCLKKGHVFNLSAWQDCVVFDWARQKSGITEKNLSPFFKVPENKIMKRRELDVIHKSVLGEYILHYKGNKKVKLSRK